MTNDQWKLLKNFKPTENWGDPLRMDFIFMALLDDFRTLVGTPIFVSCGVQGAHVERSMHYLGRAADIILPKVEREDLYKIVKHAQDNGFGGIGLYDHWHYHGKVTGGLHLDNRSQHATWMGVKESGKQVYKALSEENLIKYGFKI